MIMMTLMMKTSLMMNESNLYNKLLSTLLGGFLSLYHFDCNTDDMVRRNAEKYLGVKPLVV